MGFYQTQWRWKEDSIIYHIIGNGTNNSFCATSYDHLKLTHQQFSANWLLTLIYGQTYGLLIERRSVLVGSHLHQRLGKLRLDP